MNQSIQESQSVNISGKSGNGHATISLGKIRFDKDLSINCTIKNGLRLLPNRFVTITGGANQLRLSLKSLKGIFDFEFEGRVGQLGFDFSDNQQLSAKFFIEQAIIDDCPESLVFMTGWSLEKLEFYSGGERITPISMEHFSRNDVNFDSQKSEDGFICLFSLPRGSDNIIITTNNSEKEQPTANQKLELNFEEKMPGCMSA